MAEKPQFFQPASINEIKSLLPRLTQNSRILSGGTDLIADRGALVGTDFYLSLCACDGLSEIRSDGKYVYIGATATHNEIANNPIVKEKLNALAMACECIGSRQIRNKGTIAGNIANASPAGDTLAPLFLFESEIEILCPERGGLLLPVDEVIIGPYKNSLSYNRIITSVRIPVPPAGTRSVYVKLGSRSRVTIAMIGLAISGVFMPDGSADNITAYVGAITGQPVKIPKADEILAGKKPGAAEKEAMAYAVFELIHKLTPLQFDRLYKEKAVRGVTYDGIEALYGAGADWGE
ncbi:MAG: FAD binding domain-containing protein [Oscillospiraceae bacterium]|nr:FAD binding domain-containing protein [Oscillospiraceae bacterium]